MLYICSIPFQNTKNFKKYLIQSTKNFKKYLIQIVQSKPNGFGERTVGLLDVVLALE